MSGENLSENFARNLRYSCRYYPSISSVCRRLGINRQQFNTYLSMGVLPSVSNLKKICDFFGVDESEILLEHEIYTTIIDGKNRQHAYTDEFRSMFSNIVPQNNGLAHKLKRYHGFYHCIFLSCGHPGYIIRSFVYIREEKEVCIVKTIEHLAHRDKSIGSESNYLFKRSGILFENTGRLFIVDYEKAINTTPSFTILFPSNRNKAPILKGVHLNISGSASQLPFATRVLYKHLGPDIDIRTELRRCGLFSVNELDEPDELINEINNDTSVRGVLQALE